MCSKRKESYDGQRQVSLYSLSLGKPATSISRVSPGMRSRKLSLSLTSYAKSRTNPFSGCDDERKTVAFEIRFLWRTSLTSSLTSFGLGKVRYLNLQRLRDEQEQAKLKEGKARLRPHSNA